MNPVVLLLALLAVLTLGIGVYSAISRAFDREAAKIREAVSRKH